MNREDEYRYDEAPHVCEKHPLKSWPHVLEDGSDCVGPGLALTEDELNSINNLSRQS